ncbi:hypothetical protein KSS87_012258 [Heliosperma pusillum]|nr:hypothetical protein KSS87_012258 [Heliosperma pusillum]
MHLSLISSTSPNLPPPPLKTQQRFSVVNATMSTTGFSFLEKRDYVAPPWASHLSPIPSHIYSLGHLPTPIHRWHLPNLPPNTQLWLKRDDLSGMQLSGNKVRKLEFLMADAVAQGADCIVSIGGIQSNHCRATAVAAKYLNLDCFLILRTSKVHLFSLDKISSVFVLLLAITYNTLQDVQAIVDKDPGLTGNLLVERLVGAHVELVSKEEYANIGSVAQTNLLKERLIKEGRRPYVIPVGGSNSLGTWGYIEAIREIEQQLCSIADTRGFDDIVVACGSGGTVAGLSVGSWLGNLKAKVHAYSVCDDPNYFFEYVQGLIDGLKAGVSARDIVNIQNDSMLQWFNLLFQPLVYVYHISSSEHFWTQADLYGHSQAKGLGYAMNTEEELKFVKDVASITGIILDPVYRFVHHQFRNNLCIHFLSYHHCHTLM